MKLNNIKELEPTKVLEANSLEHHLKDWYWRINHLYKIQDKQGLLIQFKPNKFQTTLLKNLHHRNIILKARQLGMSTVMAIFFLDQMIFNSNKSSAIVADKEDNAKGIFQKISLAWKNFDPDLKKLLNIHKTTDSTQMLGFSNNSSVRVGTTLHSGTYQYLHVSEYAPLCKDFPEKAEKIKKSAFPTVPQDGFIIIESTAEGENNDYHQMVLDAMELRDKIVSHNITRLTHLDYKFFFFPWYESNDYKLTFQTQEEQDLQLKNIPLTIKKHLKNTEKHLREILKNPQFSFSDEQKIWYALMAKDLKKRMQEQYPSYPEEAFLSSGNKLFDAEIIKGKLSTETQEPKEVSNDLIIYEHPNIRHRYAIGADVAEGLGLDHSTLAVLDVDENKIVATYKSNEIDPTTFAYELARVGRMYNNAVIAPENNSLGHTTCVMLDSTYNNVYTYEIKGYTTDRTTNKLGWNSNSSSKPRMMYELAEAMQHDQNPLIIPDATILREALAFKKDDANTKRDRSGTQTSHFDLLIATAIAYQIRGEAMNNFQSKQQQSKILANRRATKEGKRNFK